MGGHRRVPRAEGPAPVARSVFAKILDGNYLTQRTEVPLREAPDSFSIVAPHEDGTFTQHYHDARGVSRLYAMTFRDGVWTLLREAADFSPLNFRQRFTATFSADGDRIDGAWELAQPGQDWQHDFEMHYRRVG
ncbi:hypothetical protein VSH64_04550 [Amycolatopsis rhabdoformis]|uniref:DUF1579 domain-containing protein n=1 Tax=Amycolatopsis rhabdoformis TaxID=1448059 RepID=A0ABZ1IA82_9PSEU|nr:hypothetical protein [Amycolatopsis rhabdoformis]WSE31379.1 hypothetical protein VSH64_04550 [Amycolatopsis rhabdoformis]